MWRELRRTGAVSVGQSAWLAPAAPAFADGITRAVQLVEAAGGEAIVLAASGRQPADAERLAEAASRGVVGNEGVVVNLSDGARAGR